MYRIADSYEICCRPHRRSQEAKYKKHVAFAVLYHSAALQVLKLHSLFGMAFPVREKWRETIPSLYRLLVPEGSTKDKLAADLSLFNKRKWSNATSNRQQKDGGWSNFPLMIWIVARLAEQNVFGFVTFGVAEKLYTEAEMPSFDDVCPRFSVGSDRGSYQMSLYDTIIFLLFRAGNGDYPNLCGKIEDVLKTCEKKFIFDDLSVSWRRPRSEKDGKKMVTPTTQKSKQGSTVSSTRGPEDRVTDKKENGSRSVAASEILDDDADFPADFPADLLDEDRVPPDPDDPAECGSVPGDSLDVDAFIASVCANHSLEDHEASVESDCAPVRADLGLLEADEPIGPVPEFGLQIRLGTDDNQDDEEAVADAGLNSHSETNDDEITDGVNEEKEDEEFDLECSSDEDDEDGNSETGNENLDELNDDPSNDEGNSETGNENYGSLQISAGLPSQKPPSTRTPSTRTPSQKPPLRTRTPSTWTPSTRKLSKRKRPASSQAKRTRNDRSSSRNEISQESATNDGVATDDTPRKRGQPDGERDVGRQPDGERDVSRQPDGKNDAAYSALRKGAALKNNYEAQMRALENNNEALLLQKQQCEAENKSLKKRLDILLQMTAPAIVERLNRHSEQKVVSKKRGPQSDVGDVPDQAKKRRRGDQVHVAPSLSAFVEDRFSVMADTYFDQPPAGTPHYLPFGTSSDAPRDNDASNPLLSVDDLKTVIANGKCKLVFHFAIIKYLEHQRSQTETSLDGGLFLSSSGPPDEIVRSRWRNQIACLLGSFQDSDSKKEICPPSFGPDESERFECFFFRVLNKEYGLPGENNHPSYTKDSTIAPTAGLPPTLWPLSDLPGKVSLANVINDTNRIKCRLLFDLLLLRYVEARGVVDTAILFDWWSGCDLNFMNGAWSCYFSLMSYHIQRIGLRDDLLPYQNENLFRFLMRATKSISSNADNFAPVAIGDDGTPKPHDDKSASSHADAGIGDDLSPKLNDNKSVSSNADNVALSAIGTERRSLLPSCREIHQSGPQMLAFRGLFFNHDGSLLLSLLGFLDFGTKHGSIRLSKNIYDFLWRMPLLLPECRKGARASKSLFGRISQFLHSQHLIDLDREYVDDACLILGLDRENGDDARPMVGGSSIQPIACSDKDSNALIEKETEQIKPPYSPARSILIGLGSGPALLAVADNYIQEG